METELTTTAISTEAMREVHVTGRLTLVFGVCFLSHFFRRLV